MNNKYKEYIKYTILILCSVIFAIFTYTYPTAYDANNRFVVLVVFFFSNVKLKMDTNI